MANDIVFTELPEGKHTRQDESFVLDGDGKVARRVVVSSGGAGSSDDIEFAHMWVEDASDVTHWLEVKRVNQDAPVFTYYDRPGGSTSTPTQPVTPLFAAPIDKEINGLFIYDAVAGVNKWMELLYDPTDSSKIYAFYDVPNGSSVAAPTGAVLPAKEAAVSFTRTGGTELLNDGQSIVVSLVSGADLTIEFDENVHMSIVVDIEAAASMTSVDWSPATVAIADAQGLWFESVGTTAGASSESLTTITPTRSVRVQMASGDSQVAIAYTRG